MPPFFMPPELYKSDGTMYNSKYTLKGGMRMTVNLDEALRYLGVKADPDGTLHAQMADLAAELQSRITPRYLWRSIDLTCNPGLMENGTKPLPHSALVQSVLTDCTRAAVLVCTLGAEFDLWVRREQARDMSRAVMLDALGSAYVEAGCDAAEDEIRARFPGMHLTDRFSPGYGDFPLDAQPALTAFAGAHRIGVTVTDSLLMNPQKSVTAVVGIADRPQPAKIRGCAYCSLRTTCTYRKAGTTCHV